MAMVEECNYLVINEFINMIHPAVGILRAIEMD